MRRDSRRPGRGGAGGGHSGLGGAGLRGLVGRRGPGGSAWGPEGAWARSSDGGPGRRWTWWWEAGAYSEDLGLASGACSLRLPPSLSSGGPMPLSLGQGVCPEGGGAFAAPSAPAPGLGQVQGQPCHCRARKALAGHAVWQLWGLGNPQRLVYRVGIGDPRHWGHGWGAGGMGLRM